MKTLLRRLLVAYARLRLNPDKCEPEHFVRRWRYPQTWALMAREQEHPRRVHLVQWLCGKMMGHEISQTESGYGGGRWADKWCRWCDKLIKVPIEESPFAMEWGHLLGPDSDESALNRFLDGV